MHLIRLVACSAADVRTAQGVGEAASRHTLRGTRAGPHPVGFVAAGTAVVAAAAGTVLQVALGAGLLERLQSAVSLSARSLRQQPKVDDGRHALVVGCRELQPGLAAVAAMTCFLLRWVLLCCFAFFLGLLPCLWFLSHTALFGWQTEFGCE